MGQPEVDAEYQEFLAFKAAKEAAAKAEEAANQPVQYYTHLADGRVEVLDAVQAGQSHYEGVRIIDKYEVGA